MRLNKSRPLGVCDFVIFMTVPIAPGWSGCRMGLAPTAARRLCTADAEADIELGMIQ